MPETQFRSLGQKDPWSRKWQPAPVFLPGKVQRSLAGCSPWGHKRAGRDSGTERACIVDVVKYCVSFRCIWQSDSVIHIHVSVSFSFFSHLDYHYRALCRVPCAMQ